MLATVSSAWQCEPARTARSARRNTIGDGNSHARWQALTLDQIQIVANEGLAVAIAPSAQNLVRKSRA